MVYEIVWTAKATQSYIENIAYLEREWTNKEVLKFISAVEDKFEVLSLQPFIGSPQNDSTRQTLIGKRISLIYRVKSRKKQIELILFWNTYQNPNRPGKFL